MESPRRNPKLEFEGIVGKLESMILTGVFQPRERLIELNLAGMLKVSRFWIRDALKILETKGLVTVAPYKGAMVSDLEENEIEEIFQVRIGLEKLAARLACEKMRPADIRALERMAKHIRACFQSEDPVAMISSNAGFHDYIYKRGGNGTLFQVISQLRARCHLLQHSSWSSPTIVDMVLREHEEFVEAFEARDLARLDQLASTHISHAMEFYLRQLRTRRALGMAHGAM